MTGTFPCGGPEGERAYLPHWMQQYQPDLRNQALPSLMCYKTTVFQTATQLSKQIFIWNDFVNEVPAAQAAFRALRAGPRQHPHRKEGEKARKEVPFDLWCGLRGSLRNDPEAQLDAQPER